MPRHSPFRIDLTREERRELEARSRKYTSPYRDVIRAKLILLAADDLPNEVIAARLDAPRQIISKWRKRFFEQRLAGLEEEPRGGRTARFSPNVVVEVKRIVCECPMDVGVPVARWSLPDLRREVLARGLVATVSGTTLWRWLDVDAIRPWRHRRWLFPRGPRFAERAVGSGFRRPRRPPRERGSRSETRLAPHRAADCPDLPHGRQPHGDHLPQPLQWGTIRPVGSGRLKCGTRFRGVDRRFRCSRREM